MTGVRESSQQSSSLKDEGYRWILRNSQHFFILRKLTPQASIFFRQCLQTEINLRDRKPTFLI
ncbi:hypothetical protein ACK3F5_15785 [Photorhabdus asymbiotica UENP]